jgi:Ca2+/Na+ antiporter
MDEAKRIVRYTLPGLVYVILLLATFALLEPDKAKEIVLNNDISFGEILGSFILSGGIGYIFSIIYFSLYWWIGGRKGHFYNHLNILNELIKSKKIEIIKPDLSDSKEQNFILNNKREAWYIINVYWYSRGKTSKAIEGIIEKINSYYSDITIGLGTTLIATFFSLLTFTGLLLVYYSNIDWFRWNVWVCLGLYMFFIYMVLLNFCRTYKAYETIIITAFATEVFKECEEHKKPVKIVFYENM